MSSSRWTMASGVALVALLLAVCGGCATTKQPALTDAKIVPPKVSPGEEAAVCVRVVDPQGIIAVVTTTVREYPDISFDLNDDGEEGDEVADDGVWSYAIEIPGAAPPGEYNWDFEAYDADGNLIKVTAETGEMITLTAEAAVEITF